MSRAKTPAINPLIGAVIGELPAPGSEFPVERQKVWLRMMAMALSTVYGGDVAASLDEPAAAPAPKAATPAPAAAAAPPPAPKKPDYPFYVSRDGYAYNKKGKRITADQVTDVLFDLRGEAGDPNAIVWADETVGLNGRSIDISVVT